MILWSHKPTKTELGGGACVSVVLAFNWFHKKGSKCFTNLAVDVPPPPIILVKYFCIQESRLQCCLIARQVVDAHKTNIFEKGPPGGTYTVWEEWSVLCYAYAFYPASYSLWQLSLYFGVGGATAMLAWSISYQCVPWPHTQRDKQPHWTNFPKIGKLLSIEHTVLSCTFT